MRRSAAPLSALLLCSAGVQAQVSGSLSLESDHRYRGYSLSDGSPVAKLLLQYEAASGWYGGAQLRRTRSSPRLEGALDVLTYGGYAYRLADGMALDVGVATYTYPSRSRVNYKEVHIGLANERVSVRASYGPNLLGFGVRTLYLQAESALTLAEGWSLFGHVGHMQTLGAKKLYEQASVTDVRVGVGTGIASWNLQLAIDGADVGAINGYRDGNWTRAGRSTLLLIATRPF